jgi:hypothetical protein
MGVRLVYSLAAAVLAIASALLSGCTTAIDTTARPGIVLERQSECESALGEYYLPKTLIRVSIPAQAPVDKGNARIVEIARGLNVADERQHLCLDYLASPLSRDTISVTRSPSGLLQRITSSVEDRTPEIAEKLIETGKNLLLAAARDLPLDVAPDDFLDLQFDPFDPEQVRITQKAIRRFGFCLFMEDWKYGVSPEEWCAGKRSFIAWEPLTPWDLPIPPDAMNHGILYRPLMPHRAFVMRQDGGRWLRVREATFDLPNGAPVMSVGVDRALFTTRKTELVFTDGILQTVHIKKGSELLGFVRIPIALANAIISVPGELLTLRINDANNKADLIDAQAQLLDSLTKLQAAGGSGRGLYGSSRAYNGCLDAYGSQIQCARALSLR